MSKKSLQKQIQSKLNKLQELIEEIIEVQVIDANEPETWDSDTLYNLAEQCQAVIKLLEDQKMKVDGLCSLVDKYQAEEEEYD